MSEGGTPQLPAEARITSQPVPGPAPRPAWLPFWLTLATIVALFAVSITLNVTAPERAEGTVGVYERESLAVSEGSVRSALGGFIAPEGWLREQGDDTDSEAGSDTVSERVEFSTADGDVWLVATLHSAVAGVDQLLRESAPVGAGFLPIAELPQSGGLETRMIAFDLEAGAGFGQRIAVCGASAPRACMLFEIAMLDPASGPQELHPDVAAVLSSVEVYA